MPIIKDTDNTIEITLKDQDGVAIDLSTLAGYVVEVYQKPNILFDQFSQQVQTGYRTTNETDAVNGVFEIYLNAANTSKGQVGREVFYEVKTLAVNANFDGATEEHSGGEISLGNLQSSVTKGQTFV